MANLNRRRGKTHQRIIAKKVGGINIGTVDGIDVLSDKFSIECKSRSKFIGYKWYEQAMKNNKYNKIPIVVVHLRNKNYDNDLVLIKLSDFLSFINGGKK